MRLINHMIGMSAIIATIHFSAFVIGFCLLGIDSFDQFGKGLDGLLAFGLALHGIAQMESTRVAHRAALKSTPSA